jgi:tRNA threonylcarbamoyladenosine biosynthesis protein TsaB
VSESGGWLLAIDTATNTIVVAAGTIDGRLLQAQALEGRYRHSQELLPAVARLMEQAGLGLADVAGIVVGIGPGAFTGLRVGLATAKTLAHELRRPVVGIPTSAALLAGAAASGAVDDGRAVLLLPSGPRDRVAVVAGEPPVIVRGDEPAAMADSVVTGAGSPIEIAIDLDGRASDAALALGRRAIAALPQALVRLGAARLAAGERDDPERLVPQYASAPRGAPSLEPQGDVAWSRDPR